MPIGTIETISQRIRKLVSGRADGVPNSLESMVVCRSCLCVRSQVLLCLMGGKMWMLVEASMRWWLGPGRQSWSGIADGLALGMEFEGGMSLELDV
jgi:hypothetical protein